MLARFREAEQKVGKVQITVDPPDAEVIVDGKSVGRGPWTGPLFLDPGKHALELRAEGRRPRRELIDVLAGLSIGISMTLPSTEQLDAPAAVAPAGAGAKGPESAGAPAGAAGAAAAKEPAKWPRPMPVPVMVVGGVGIAGMITGAVLLGVGSADRSSAEEHAAEIRARGRNCVAGSALYDPRCEVLDAETRASDLKHDAGVGTLVGGAALTAGAVIWWLLPPPSAAGPAPGDGAKEKKTSLRLRAVPDVGTTGGGVTVLGWF